MLQLTDWESRRMSRTSCDCLFTEVSVNFLADAIKKI